MAFQMKGSPAKRGEIQGTSGHASALKVKSWFVKQGVKHGPKIADAIGDAYRWGKNLFNPSQAAINAAKLDKLRKGSTVGFMDHLKALGGATAGTGAAIEASKIITSEKAADIQTKVSDATDDPEVYLDLRRNKMKDLGGKWDGQGGIVTERDNMQKKYLEGVGQPWNDKTRKVADTYLRENNPEYNKKQELIMRVINATETGDTTAIDKYKVK